MCSVKSTRNGFNMQIPAKKHSQLEHSRWNVKSFLGNTCGSVPHSSAAFDAEPQSCKVMQQIVLWSSSLCGRLPSKVSRLVRKLLPPQSTSHAACLPRDLVYIPLNKNQHSDLVQAVLCCLPPNYVHIPECTAISKHVEPKGKVGTAETATEIDVVALTRPTEGEIHFA